MKFTTNWFAITVAVGVLGCVPNLRAQSDSITARISGDRNSSQGKCTFEVVVDDVAEVMLRGNEGRLRTVSGNPATWRRLDCNMPLPANPRNFRFEGVDGRGRQTLVRQPNRNGGVAVVRLEDPKNGSEGYTGDLIWDNTGGGYDSDRRPGFDDDRYGDRDNADAPRVCRQEVARRFRTDSNNVRTRTRDRRRDITLVDFQVSDNFGVTSGTCGVSSSGEIVSFKTNDTQ